MKTERILLPPRRHHVRPKKSLLPWSVAAAILIAVLGCLMAFYMGYSRGQNGTDPKTAQASQNEPALSAKEAAQVEKLLAEARVRVAERDWLKAGNLYRSVLEVDGSNAEAKVTLPLIEQNLNKARGGFALTTDPAGATVTVADQPPQQSPAEFTGLPFGKYSVEVSLEGYEPVRREIKVDAEEVRDAGKVTLVKSAGMLSISSEPEDVPFELYAADKEDDAKLVLEGKTPADLNGLPPGAYKVVMTRDDWPAFTRTVEVQHNRETSVSHVFARGGLQITSDPAGAEVWLRTSLKENSRLVGETPISLSDLPAGRVYLELRQGDWPSIRRTVDVAGGKEQKLDFAWKRGLVTFQSDPPGAAVYMDGDRVGATDDTTPFQWEMPEGDYDMEARHESLGFAESMISVRSSRENEAKFSFDYGSVSISSDPPGADVFVNGEPVGKTPLRQPVVRPGEYRYTVSKERYQPAIVAGTVNPGQTLEFNTRLKFEPTPRIGQHFTNGQGQEMRWVEGLKGWVAAEEVSQGVYEAIIVNDRGLLSNNPSQFKGKDLPVDSVSWYQADHFCQRLTVEERAAGLVPPGYAYSLPSDEEWSFFVGDAKLEDSINSAAVEQKSTSPVRSGQPNQYGLYNTRGNVWEWCENWYTLEILRRAENAGAPVNRDWAGTERKILRGGAWNRSSKYDLDVGYRLAAPPSDDSRRDAGFRVVLLPEN